MTQDASTADALRAAVEHAIACPHCKGEFQIKPVAHFQKQTLYLSLKYEGDSMSLTTVAGTLVNMDKMLRAVALEVGQKAHVFLQSVEQKEHELVFGLLVTEARPKPKKAAAAIRGERKGTPHHE